MLDITVRDVPEQLVLTEQRHVLAADLPGWIGATLDRHHREVPPGAGAPSFVLYHGMVTEDSDGPAEVCTPVPEHLAGRVSLPTRTEPAHREAYLSLSRSQAGYPQILDAYRALEDWVRAQGHTRAGPAREVYVADPDQDTAPVLEVALPVARAGAD